MFSSKIFQDFPSHQMFGHMHGALNIGHVRQAVFLAYKPAVADLL
jgi:hypothetical protein